MAHVGDAVVTADFEESEGQTRLTLRQLFPSKEALEGALASGMERGMRMTLDQLDELVASMRLTTPRLFDSSSLRVVVASPRSTLHLLTTIPRGRIKMRCETAEVLADGRLVSPSAERNKGLLPRSSCAYLPAQGEVLEVSSGTGQHVLHFAQAMPHIRWQPTERDPELAEIDRELARATIPAKRQRAAPSRRARRELAGP